MRCRICNKEFYNEDISKILCDDCLVRIVLGTAVNEYIPIKRTTKLLIVEDGSVDIECCEQDLLDMGIKILVYRQGSRPPMLYEIKE